MIDLKNVDFIVPLRIDTGDRLRNVIMTTAYLLHHFDCTVTIKEVDSEHRFEEYALPIIKRLVDTKNLNHIWEEETRTDDAFHRTKVLNDMVMDSKCDIVVNYDTDLILPVDTYTQAVEMLQGEYDVVYPYRFGNHGERKVNLPFTIETQEDMDNFETKEVASEFIKGYDNTVLDDHFFYYHSEQGYGWAEYGMVQFFNRQAYIDGYLENENFIAYAPEDCERHHRWQLLGYNIGRVDNYAYHLEHQRTQNSWYHNPHMQRNNQLWEELRVLTKEQLIAYYEDQQYVKERLK